MASRFQITGGEVLVDDDILPFLACTNWHISYVGEKYQYARTRPARGIFLGQPITWVQMHRLIANVVTTQGVVVDHVNGNTLDNRRENLRITTHEKNTQDFSRRTYGNEHPLSKFSDGDIARILQLRSEGCTHQSIANEFNVGRTIIRSICTGHRGIGTQVGRKGRHSSADSAPRR